MSIFNGVVVVGAEDVGGDDAGEHAVVLVVVGPVIVCDWRGVWCHVVTSGVT